MKYHFYSVVLAGLLLASCDIASFREEQMVPPATDTISAYFADFKTKTYLLNDAGDLSWSAGDEISLFFNSGSQGGTKYLTELGGETVEFVGTDPAEGAASGVYYGIYPYDSSSSVSSGVITTVIPDTQIAEENTFADRMLVTVGKSTDKSIGFYHICGGIRFSVSKSGYTSVVFKSNNGERISGAVSVTFGSDGKPSAQVTSPGYDSITLNCKEGFEPGKFYYICMAPVVLSKGFSMTFSGSSTAKVSHNTYIEIDRAVFGSINTADLQSSIDRIKSGKMLATNGTANCYIVSSAGDYKFPAVMGNSSSYLGQMASAELMWETDNTASPTAKNSIISSVSCSSSAVFFSTPDQLKAGNALIVAKDASGSVIWSWHIWVVPGFNPDSTPSRFMERNLGALSSTTGDARANGLFYQWGRKDPFAGFAGNSVGSATSAQTGAQMGSVSVSATSGDLDFAIAHPNMLITSDSDWLSPDNRNNNLWAAKKTIYDPCPPGWRVPEGAENQGLPAFTVDQSNKGASTTQNGVRLWFPSAGYINPSSARATMIANVGFYWSCTAETLTSVTMYVDTYNQYRVNTYYGHIARASALSVRCIKE